MSATKFSPLVLAALLAACGQGTGTGATGGASSSSDAKDTESIKRASSLDIGKSSRASVSMPASGLIADALRDWAVASKVDPSTVRNLMLSSVPLMGDRWSPVSLADRVAANQMANPLWYQRNLDQLDVDVQRYPQLSDVLDIKHQCARLGADGHIDGAKQCLQDFYTREMAGLAILAAHASRSGWEVDPLERNSGVELYMRSNSAIAEFASVVEAQIAGGLSAKTLRDPDDAKAKILLALYTMPVGTLKDAAEEAKATVMANWQGGVVVDTVTGRGMGWAAGGSNYQGDQKGWSIVRNGITWFGDGAANGKRYELALESSISARRSRSGDTSATASAGSGGQISSQAQVR